jgi:tripartite-type tricarboxylate transporter receptor subunit TctC
MVTKEMTMTFRIALVIFCVSLFGQTAVAQHQDLYAGKVLRLIINFAPGGAADTEGRLFARYIGGLIDGKPQVLAQNIAGGGLAATNYVGRAAPDVMILGYLTGIGARAAFEPELFQVPFDKFEMVAYIEGATIYYVRRDVTPRLSQPTDILRAERLFAGGLSAGSSKDLTMRLMLDMLGVKHGYVTGYSGAGPLRIAFESGEVHMLSDGRATYNTAIAPMVETGSVLPLWVDTGFDGGALYVLKGNHDMDLPPFHEFYQRVKGVPPSGPLWEAYLALLASNAMLQRIITFPPGTSREYVNALRAGVERLNKDPEFTGLTMKTFGYVPEYDSGPEVQGKITRMIQVPDSTRDFIKKYIAVEQNSGVKK